MKTISFILFTFFISCSIQKQNKKVFTQTDIINNWRVINDGVMGGFSTGEISTKENIILYRGNISLANNGGFSSLKSPFQEIDLSDKNIVEIKMKGSGINMAFTIELHKQFYKPYFKHDIKLTSTNTWETVRINLENFKEYIIGKPTYKKITKEELSNAIRIGFISNEKKESPFNYEIEYIKIY